MTEGSGKTYWAQQQRKSNPRKQYIIIGISSIMDKMKVYKIWILIFYFPHNLHLFSRLMIVKSED